VVEVAPVLVTAIVDAIIDTLDDAVVADLDALLTPTFIGGGNAPHQERASERETQDQR
jgi:hypothetical protein